MDDLFCLVKFGKLEHLKSLLRKGELYFNKPESYTHSIDHERGDILEGAIRIENDYILNVKAIHPELGPHTFNAVKNNLGRVVEYNFNYLSLSIYSVSSDNFCESDAFKIDDRMESFGSHFIMINKPYLFIDKVISELRNQDLKFKINKVNYQNLSLQGVHNINPFVKDSNYSHQFEVRIIIENKNNRPKTIYVGPIHEFCFIGESKSMTETKWKAKRVYDDNKLE